MSDRKPAPGEGREPRQAAAADAPEIEAVVETAVDAVAQDTDITADADADSVEADVKGESPEDSEGVGDGGVPVPAPIVVQCPQCAVPADPADLCCPSCHEDLAALVRLRYAGRIAFNDALGLLRGGRREAAVVALERAVAEEPGLAPAELLLARLSPGPASGPAASTPAAAANATSGAAADAASG